MTRRSVLSMVAAGALAAVFVMQPAVAAQSPTTLGTVRLSRGVMADGKALPAGSYSLRVSAEAVKTPVGQAADSVRWIEFVQGGEVKGRELASVVPSADGKQVLKGTGPAPGAARVDLLRGGEYLRVWANRGGIHYLVHLVIS
jgi:hypothetical protein